MPNPEVLVVGGGPGGIAAAYWLARSGHEVVVAERSGYPREKTCGDGLTPRSIHQLLEMGFDFSISQFHRTEGLRAFSGDLELELEWPDHPVFPNWGGVIRRADLDGRVAALAEKQGALVRTHTEAKPVLDGGRLVSVDLIGDGETERVDPDVVVVADGSLSRFGRALGASRDRSRPYGLAARGYYASPRSDDEYLESHLDLRGPDGATVPGYGWIFPLGDGVVNVGVGVISTFHGWRDVNTNILMEALVASAPATWGLSTETALTRPRGGKLPMSFSVGPKVGPNWVLVGDAAGAINPFNGEGIDYAYETGRIAAHHVGRAIEARDSTLLQGYAAELDDVYGLYYRVSRAFVRAVGKPGVMRTLTRIGLRSRPLMDWVLRVMANLLDPSERNAGEAAYRMIEQVVRIGPDP
jgi:geranylgeranyl reductase family protein